MKDGFLLADSKLEVYQEWVLLLKHLKEYDARPFTYSHIIAINSGIYK